MSNDDARAASFHKDADDPCEDDRAPCPGCHEPASLGCEADCVYAALALAATEATHASAEVETRGARIAELEAFVRVVADAEDFETIGSLKVELPGQSVEWLCAAARRLVGKERADGEF